MATQVNLIENGGFDEAGTFSTSGGSRNYDASWGGNNHEVYTFESRYINGGSKTDRVAEMDETFDTTSTYTQGFEVVKPGTGTLSFESAMRTSEMPSGVGDEGFKVEVLDASNNPVFSQDIFPKSDAVTIDTYKINFDTPGTYTLSFTELGDNDGAGAIIDDVALMICFGGETNLETEHGEKPASEIRVGDRLAVQDGLQTVRWVGKRQLTPKALRNNPHLRPIKISQGALGMNLPQRDLWVSPHHRMLVHSDIAQEVFGEKSALVEAKKLVGLKGIDVDYMIDSITYVHILFDNHEIVFAEGAPSESLYLGPCAKKALSKGAIKEISAIFPDLELEGNSHKPAAIIPALNAQKKFTKMHYCQSRELIEL